MGDNKKQPDGISYFPDRIETVMGKHGPMHIDPDTGQRTYPSWYKRAQLRMILPEDLGKSRREPTRDDELLLHALAQAMHIEGHEPGEGIKTKPVVRAIMKIRGIKTFAAYKVLYGLWRAGLVQRVGRIYGNGNRPMHQRWYLDEPTDF